MRPEEDPSLKRIMHEAEELTLPNVKGAVAFRLYLRADTILRLRNHLNMGMEVNRGIINSDPEVGRGSEFEDALHEESMPSVLIRKLYQAFPTDPETLSRDSQEERPKLVEVSFLQSELDYLDGDFIEHIESSRNVTDSSDPDLDKWWRDLDFNSYTEVVGMFLDVNRALQKAGGMPPSRFFQLYEETGE